MATLTLSRVEQAAVHRHLELVYGRLCMKKPPHADCFALHRFMTLLEHNTTLGLTKLEIIMLVRHLRVQRTKLQRDMAALEERRLRGGFNGQLDAAHGLVAADVAILNEVIRRLWAIL